MQRLVMITFMISVGSLTIWTSEPTEPPLQIKPAEGQQSIIYIMHIVEDWGNPMDSWEKTKAQGGTKAYSSA